MFQGGGNIPLIMPIVTELALRGHDVSVLPGPGIRSRPIAVSQWRVGDKPGWCGERDVAAAEGFRRILRGPMMSSGGR
jgi:hypothetical protein